VDESPERVVRANERARAAGFSRSCSAETGRLLRFLASTVRSGTICELGCGYGAGTSWLHSGLANGVRLLTVDADPAAVAATRSIFNDCPDVTVLEGDWTEAARFGPYQLMFVDGGPVTYGSQREVDRDQQRIFELLLPGGVAIKDDLTPPNLQSGGRWTPEQVQSDPLRRFWFNHPGAIATEVVVGPTEAVLLASRDNDTNKREKDWKRT